jgi:methionine-rich copper-binding protein CopC
MKYPKVLLLSALTLASAWLHAHTGLAGATPADGAVLHAAPAALELDFTGDVQLLKVEVVDAADVVQPLEFQPSADAAKTFAIPLPALAPAAYEVSWTVLGADGHRVEGTFGFTVDPAATESAGTASEHQGH